jgi:uncharacterized protein (UPF0147 family)
MLQVQTAVEALVELRDDPSVSKNIRARIDKIIGFLEHDPDLGKDKAIVEIEEIIKVNGVDPHLRSQIWNVVSLLESF